MTGLDALVSGLFDYAGTSPPASLDLESALRESAGFPKVLRRPGMVAADIVVAADQLPRLDPKTLARCGFAPGRVLRACALTSPDTAVNAAEAVTRFNAEGRDAGRSVASLEFRLDPKRQTDPAAIVQLLSRVRSRLSPELTVYVEPSLSEGEGAAVAEVLSDTLAAFTRRGAGAAGMKLRCGGAHSLAPKVLAAAVLHSARSKLAFKAVLAPTLPLMEPERSASLPGFVNLAAAVLLSRALGLEFPPDKLAACLQSSRPALFDFGAGLRWSDFSLGPEELQKARAAAPLTLATGDLREPDVGLQRVFPSG